MTITGHIVLVEAKPEPDFERDNPPITYHIPPSRVQRVYQLPGDDWWRIVLDAKFAIITKDEPKELLAWMEKSWMRYDPEILPEFPLRAKKA